MGTKLRITTKLGKSNICFLKREKVLLPFFINIKKVKSNNEIEYLINKESVELINFAFCWCATKEGHGFWENIDERYRHRTMSKNEF